MWKGKSLFFKRRLAAVLAVRGMGQRELAEMCKVTPRTVRNWLSGKVPSSTVFALISTKWGEDTCHYLVGESNTMPEPQNPEPAASHSRSETTEADLDRAPIGGQGHG